MLVCCGTPPNSSVDDAFLPYPTQQQQQRRHPSLEGEDMAESLENSGAVLAAIDSSAATNIDGETQAQGVPAKKGASSPVVPEVSPARCTTRQGAPGGSNNSVRRDSGGVDISSTTNSTSKRRKRPQPDTVEGTDGKQQQGQQQRARKNGGSGGPPKKRPTTIPDDDTSADGGGIGQAVAASLVMTPMKRRQAREQKRREEAEASASGGEDGGRGSPGGSDTGAGEQAASSADSPYHARQISWAMDPGSGSGGKREDGGESAHANPDGTVEVVLNRGAEKQEGGEDRHQEEHSACSSNPPIKFRPSRTGEEYGHPSPGAISASASYDYSSGGYPPYRYQERGSSSYGQSPGGRYLSYAPSWEQHLAEGAHAHNHPPEDVENNLITPPKSSVDEASASHQTTPPAASGAAVGGGVDPSTPISHTESFDRQWRAQGEEAPSSGRSYPPYRRPDYSPVRRPEGNGGSQQEQDHRDYNRGPPSTPYRSPSHDSQDYAQGAQDYGGQQSYPNYGYSPVRQPSYPPQPRRSRSDQGSYSGPVAAAPAPAVSESFDTSDGRTTARRELEAPPTPTTPYTPGSPAAHYYDRYGPGMSSDWPSTPSGSLPPPAPGPPPAPRSPYQPYSPVQSSGAAADYGGYYGHRDYPPAAPAVGASRSHDDERDHSPQGSSPQGEDDEVHPLLKGYDPDQDSPSHKGKLTRVTGNGEEIEAEHIEEELAAAAAASGSASSSPSKKATGGVGAGPKLPRSIISKSGKTARTAKALQEGISAAAAAAATTAPGSPAKALKDGTACSVSSDATPRVSNLAPLLDDATADKPENVAIGVNILTGAAALIQPKAASEIDFELTRPPKHPIEPPGAEPAYRTVADLTSQDVLLGRGGGTNTQVGNRRYRQLVQEFQPVYLMARRKEKPLLARTIVLVVRTRGGKFVKKDDVTGMLYEVGDEKAEAKTSQALREGLDVRATKSAANSVLKKDKAARRKSSSSSKKKGGSSKASTASKAKKAEDKKKTSKDSKTVKEEDVKEQQQQQHDDDDSQPQEYVHDPEVPRDGPPPSTLSRTWSHESSEEEHYDEQPEQQQSPQDAAPPTPTSSGYGPGYNQGGYSNQQGYGGYGGYYQGYQGGGHHGPPPPRGYYPPPPYGYQSQGGQHGPPQPPQPVSSSSGSFDSSDPYRKRPRDGPPPPQGGNAPYPPPPHGYNYYGRGGPHGGPHPPPPPHSGYGPPPPGYPSYGYPRHGPPPPYDHRRGYGPPPPHHKDGRDREDEEEEQTMYPDFSPPRAKMARSAAERE